MTAHTARLAAYGAMGLPLAIVFAVVVFRLIYVLLRRAPLAAWVGTCVFFLAVLSNNMLATKTPVVTIIVLLLLSFVGTAPPRAQRP